MATLAYSQPAIAQILTEVIDQFAVKSQGFRVRFIGNHASVYTFALEQADGAYEPVTVVTDPTGFMVHDGDGNVFFDKAIQGTKESPWSPIEIRRTLRDMLEEFQEVWSY